MKIYVFGETAICLEMDTETRKMRFLSFDEQDNVEALNKKRRQHILRLNDSDVSMIGTVFQNNGYALA